MERERAYEEKKLHGTNCCCWDYRSPYWWGDTGWATALLQTIAITVIPGIIGGLLGLLFGLGLVLTVPDDIFPHRGWFSFDKTVSFFRSLPFIILLAVIAPVTQLIVGTQIGMVAAMVPLSVAVFPFYARQVQVKGLTRKGRSSPVPGSD